MQENSVTISPVAPTRLGLWLGWILTAIPSLMLLSGAFFAWSGSQQVVESTVKFGFQPGFLPIMGTVEFVCAVLYLVPRTAVLGALLITAYMGGAVVTHLRVHDPQWMVPVAFGAIVWAGLLLRRPALRKAMLTL